MGNSPSKVRKSWQIWWIFSLHDVRDGGWNEINRKLRVATKKGSKFFWFSQVTGQLKSCKMIIYHQQEISDR
jgi:hypothetical protein